MWRSIIIYNKEKIKIKDGILNIESENNIAHFPLEDINCIVIDNLQTIITTYALKELSAYNILVILCNESHLPSSITLPLSNNYHLYKVFKMQSSLTNKSKNILWDIITTAKIINQSIVLALCDCNENTVNRMIELSKEVYDGDAGNREGIAAKMFFRSLYGANFIRTNDTAINSALDYGYAIMRSIVARNLAASGFQLMLGLHHISETNAYNLADDLMEPLRPIVDLYVNNNIDYIVNPLTRDVRSDLVNLINKDVIYDGKIVKIRYAVEMMVKSLYTALDSHEYNKFKVPMICKTEQ